MTDGACLAASCECILEQICLGRKCMKLSHLMLLVATALASCASPLARASTPTESPMATATPLPTATSVPVLILAEFAPAIIGVGTHGNMACLDYQGSAEDLRNVTLSATISQGGTKLAAHVPQ